MPFWRGETDAANTGASTSTLRVDPAQVLSLKAEIQAIHDDVDMFLNRRAPMMAMRPLGADPVSDKTATAFNENARSALNAARGYLDELKRVLDALDQVAKAYNLVEDANTQAFRQATS